jgi:light-regulated signal transduction histidine kinase (bacteriophytochrome)
VGEHARGAPPGPSPGFGQADLSNCEREQIHLAGSIQPHGALLLVREPDLVVVQASANAAKLLHLEAPILGQSLGEFGGDLAARLRPHLGEALREIPAAVRVRVGRSPRELDGLIHRPPGGGLILELEPAGPADDLSPRIAAALKRITTAFALRSLCDEAAKGFKELAGYDRVMVYRFDPEGHGEVLAERREPGLEPFLGNRYPASDIPQIARQLYERNRIRMLVDVAYQPVPLAPRVSPLSGEELDMSLCSLRSMSPIHIQYLKNMGVAATLVASLLVGGRLWGLIACHHYRPRVVHYQMRVACELLSEAVATRIAALEGFAQAQAELTVRRLEQRMIDAIAQQGDWRAAFFDQPQAVLQPLTASGVALLCDGQILTAGEVPGTAELRALGVWLDRQPRVAVRVTASLGSEAPELASLTPVASGVLAAPVSSCAGEYLAWFRPERVRTVTWGGDPMKPFEVGDDPSQLSPRRSFAKWHQVVEGTCEPWLPAEVTTGRLIAESVADVIQQFRSVRLLIAQEQLDKIRLQVRGSEQPVAVADAQGRVLFSNERLERLLDGAGRLPSLEDLPAFFADPERARAALAELFGQRRPWRGEVVLAVGAAAGTPFLVRVDPVLSSAEHVLGYVALLTDLSGRRAADEARRRFQQSIVSRHQIRAIPVDSAADLRYRELMTTLVENAQLAGLEITDGSDLTQVPEMLASVQTSVARTTELLEHLLWYSSPSPPKPS